MSEPGPVAKPKLIVAGERHDLAARLDEAGVRRGQPVVVLIGGAMNMDSDGAPDLAPTVRDGIIATAQRIGATVIDGGTDAGVMALAGRARRDLEATIPLVGVAPIGKVQAGGIPGASGHTAIEPNHTHVVLVPGAEWGAEVPWLVEAAHLIAGDQPIVAVAVDGGQVAGVEANKAQAEGWPLITVAGTGRTADDLARIASHRSTGDPAPPGGVHVIDLSEGPAALAALIESLCSEEGASPANAAVDPIEYPALYAAVSEASRRGHRTYRAMSAAELALATLGIALGVAGGLFVGKPSSSGDPFAIAILVGIIGCFLLAFVIKIVGQSAGYDDDWRTGRSVAEGVKSQSWRYMTRAVPYDGDDADDRFGVTIETLLRRAIGIRQFVDRLSPGSPQISPSMQRVRKLDLDGRRSIYSSRRLQDQSAWYASKSAAHRRSAGRLFALTITAQLAAALSAFLALALAGSSDFGPTMLRLVSLFASLGLAFATWTQLNRNHELAVAYAYVFQELRLMAGALERAKSESTLSAAVTASEDTIARENRAWLAKSAEILQSPEFGGSD